MNTLKVIIIGSITLLSGCTGMSTMNQDFVMSGSAEGLRAYGDFVNGSLRTAKEDPKRPNAYLSMRKDNEREVTIREVSNKAPVGFLQKLFSGSSEEPSS